MSWLSFAGGMITMLILMWIWNKFTDWVWTDDEDD